MIIWRKENASSHLDSDLKCWGCVWDSISTQSSSAHVEKRDRSQTRKHWGRECVRLRWCRFELHCGSTVVGFCFGGRSLTQFPAQPRNRQYKERQRLRYSPIVQFYSIPIQFHAQLWTSNWPIRESSFDLLNPFYLQMSSSNSLSLKREETTIPNLLLERFWPLEFLTDRSSHWTLL